MSDDEALRLDAAFERGRIHGLREAACMAATNRSPYSDEPARSIKDRADALAAARLRPPAPLSPLPNQEEQ